MVNTSRRFKLEYNDAVDGTTVIAETGQDTGALKIDRHYHQRRQKDPDILKVWLEGTNFGNAIPTRKSEFGTAQNNTDEPEILYKQYNPDTSSFDTKGRFFAKNTGTINEQGQLALKLYSFMRFTERQSVDTNTVSTDIEAALNEVLPSGYVADVPSGATVPSVDGYSINARREKGYHELTRDYKFIINFTGELDDNNDYKVKFEPEGFGGTVDTIIDNQQAGSYAIQSVDTGSNIFTVVGDRTNELAVNQAIEVVKSTGNDGTYTINSLSYDSGNNETDITVDENVSDSTSDGLIIPGSQAILKTWEKDKTDAIINKVKVEGTNSSGTTITGTATNQTQIDNFGEKFLKVKRGYIESQSDADTIAEKYLVPGLKDNGDDITTVPENGTVKTTVYSDNVLNDSFQVVSNKRNIDDTYTVASQKNFWPEAASVLEFEFEAENLEEAARETENLRDERGRLYPNDQTDVGNQPFTGDTGSAPSDTQTTGGVNDNNSDTNITGALDVQDVGEGIGQGVGIIPKDSGPFDTIQITREVPQSATQIVGGGDVIGIYAAIDFLNNSGQSLNFDYEIENTDTSTILDSGNESVSDGSAIQIPIVASGPSDLDDIQATVTSLDANGNPDARIDTDSAAGFFTRIAFTIQSYSEHTHPDTYDTDDNPHGHTDDIDTTDNNHGGTGDPTGQHGTSGTTDAKNVEVATEDKTDR